MEDKTETAWVMRHMRVSSMVMVLLGMMMVGGGGWVIWDSVNRSEPQAHNRHSAFKSKQCCILHFVVGK